MCRAHTTDEKQEPDWKYSQRWVDGELPTIEFEKVYKQIINMDIDLLSKIVKEIILDKDEVSLPGLDRKSVV